MSENIIDTLRKAGMTSVLDRLNFLIEEIALEDGKMDVDSMQNAVRFIVENEHLTVPDIVVNDDGLFYLRWKIGEKGIFGMEFLADDSVRFVGKIDDPDGTSKKSSGTIKIQDIPVVAESFLERVSKRKITA